jgi:hypothetical protein
MLEKSRPFTPDDEVLTHMVDSFLAIGKPLLIGELEGADRDDLFSLFFDFGRLALQMWRLKVDIKVQRGGGPWTPHPKRTTWSDGRDLGISHPTGNAPGESIFLMQPLIASTLEHGADLGSGPVWSKAVLWFHETTNPC